jgi:ComF family protein
MNKLKLARKLCFVREYLLPLGCAVCGRTLFGEAEAWTGLCEECAEGFRADGERRCSVCGRPLISELEICMSCRKSGKNHYDGMTLLYPYAGKSRTLLRAYKFGKHRVLSRFFSEKLLSAASRLAGGGQPEAANETVWIPVPPRAGKIKEAGWDQVECIARTLEKFHKMPVTRCLKRMASKTQKKLGKMERMTNLKGRITCVKAPPEQAILFDDVFTTGSTMNVCAEALKAAGAKKVYGVCLFYD